MTLMEWRKIKSADWQTSPISPTCEVMDSHQPLHFCDKATSHAYPAMGGGWMALCVRHARKHTEAFSTDELITQGETWA